jgi:Ca-activated chloride channel homolog
MTISDRWIVIGLVVCASLVPRETAAQNDRPTAGKTLSPYFLVEGGDPAVDRLPLKDTRVDVAISGVIADVVVRQVYENRGQRPLHARYVFPASIRAAVYGMTMTVGDVRIVARIKEREQARVEFDNAKRDGKSASLLEQDRPNVFKMNVANVMPGDTISVELRYTEILVPTDGVYEFVYPTVVGPRYSEKRENEASPADDFVKAPYAHAGQPPRSEFHLTAVVSTGVPIRELWSPSHQLVSPMTTTNAEHAEHAEQVRSARSASSVLTVADSGRAEIALADSERFGGNRDFILRYRLSGEQIASGLLLYQGDGENFFLLTAQPPRAVMTEDLPPREYIFVVDVSGSMTGFPLDTAKELMTDLVDVLRPSDTFNIVVFASGSETFSPASLPATHSNLARALKFLGRQHGGGGTQLLAALEEAVAVPRQPAVSRTVVLLTDGYVDTEREVFDYVRDQLHETNFFAFGIGSSVNRFLIEGVARAGLGEPFVVTGPDEATDTASRFRRYIDSPVLTGIDIGFVGFDAYDVEPKNIPDLFASRPIVVFGKWRGPAGGSIEISGKTGREPYRSSIPVTPASADPRHSALRFLWARTRIANLTDFGADAADDQTIAEIASLGLTYGLLTRYTSFIAVQEIIRHTGVADDVDQPLPMPAGVSDNAIGVTIGAEPDLVWLCAIALALFGCASLLRSRRAGSGVVS